MTTLVCSLLLAADAGSWEPIDAVVESAIQAGDCPGAVLLVLHEDRVVYRKAYGHRVVKPMTAPMTPDAIFDLASLTKPVATASSIWLLIEQAKLHLDDPVTKFWPEFAANGKDKVTIAHLLLHTSGLTPDNALADYQDGPKKALERIAALKLLSQPGERFRYSDVGFIVLAHLVERISGKSIDVFAQENLFAPLGMSDTSFRPKASERMVPTTKLAEVHDPRASAMGGIAGHAGLFASADDLATFCQMLIAGGQHGEVRLFSEKTVREMTRPRTVSGDRRPMRSYGWDVDTPYTSQAGETFRRRDGFGHTGFTGTSIWIDRPSRTAIILLTSRLHPDGKGNVVKLRKQLGTMIADRLKP